MANWEKLNKEFDDALDNMTSEDWVLYSKRKEQKVIDWWENLSEEDQRSLEIDYGYFGHDQGLTIDDIVFIYKQEH